MLKITTEYTRSGSFAAWEGGGYNKMSNLGWSGLITDHAGNKLVSIYERPISRSKNHFLFRIEIGYYAVVTNIRPNPSTQNVWQVRCSIGRFNSLATEFDNLKNAQRVVANTEIVATHNFLSNGRQHAIDFAEKIPRPAIKDAPESLIAALAEMMKLSVEKAWTESDNQRLFWGTRRPQKPEVEDAPTEHHSNDQPDSAFAPLDSSMGDLDSTDNN